jgi:hypothetical protein
MAVRDQVTKDTGPQVRSQHDTVRMMLGQPAECQPTAAQSEAVTSGRQPDHRVDQMSRNQAKAEHCQQLPYSRHGSQRRTAVRNPLHQFVDDLPLWAGFPRRSDHGLGGLTERRGINPDVVYVSLFWVRQPGPLPRHASEQPDDDNRRRGQQLLLAFGATFLLSAPPAPLLHRRHDIPPLSAGGPRGCGHYRHRPYCKVYS